MNGGDGLPVILGAPSELPVAADRPGAEADGREAHARTAESFCLHVVRNPARSFTCIRNQGVAEPSPAELDVGHFLDRGWDAEEFLPGQRRLPPFAGGSYFSRIGLKMEAQSA